jgi:hypothetical protein
MKRSKWMPVAVAAAAVLCLGITNIDPVQKLSWGENIGWLNWRDANGGLDGVRVHATFLSGHIWSENAGWIRLGTGAPADGIAYDNVEDIDFGVNIDPPTGDLFGLAWGENIGWINFDTRTSLSPHGQQARLESNRFRGYAWGENVGWINLDDATHFPARVPVVCSLPFADVDGDGDVDQDDFAIFQACYSGPGRPAGPGCECFDRPRPGFPRGDNAVDADDLAAFDNCRSGPAIPADPGCN